MNRTALILNTLLADSINLLVVPSPQSSKIEVRLCFKWIDGRLRERVGIAADVPRKLIIILNGLSNFRMFRDLFFERWVHFCDTDNTTSRIVLKFFKYHPMLIKILGVFCYSNGTW